MLHVVLDVIFVTKLMISRLNFCSIRWIEGVPFSSLQTINLSLLIDKYVVSRQTKFDMFILVLFALKVGVKGLKPMKLLKLER